LLKGEVRYMNVQQEGGFGIIQLMLEIEEHKFEDDE
jgi:hypothetical protein